MMFRRTLHLALTLQLLLTQLLACHCHAGHAACGGAVRHVHLPGPTDGGHRPDHRLESPHRDNRHGHGHHGHRHKHSHGHKHSHRHKHSHAGTHEDAAPATGDTPDRGCPGHGDHDSDAYPLPDDFHAERPSVGLTDGTLVLFFVPPGNDPRRLLGGVLPASGVPPDPLPPGLPVYLRTLRILV